MVDMDDPAVLTGIAAIITALSTLIGLVIKLMSDLKRNTVTTNATAVMVNNKSDETTSRIDQLTQSVVDLGGTVPVDPAIAAAHVRMADHAAHDQESGL